MHKLRVGVCMGGKNIEREVSFNSGRTVCDHLDSYRYEIIPLFQRLDGTFFILPWHFLHRGKIADFEHRLEAEAQKITVDQLKERIDFMYHAMPGKYAEDGILQGTLEVLGIPYLGSGVLASALCMNKAFCNTILAEKGVKIPPGVVILAADIEKNLDMQNIKKKLSKQNIVPPLVVKPAVEGSSLGITIVHDIKNLKRAIKTAGMVDKTKTQDVLIEQKIEGMEFSCITLVDYHTGDYISLPPTEIVLEQGVEYFDYEQKYMPGRAQKHTPPRTSREIISKIQQTCSRVMKTLEITTLSRIDGIVTKSGEVVIIEPNTLSGMAPNSFLFREAAEIGMSHSQLINHLIETELEQYGMLNAILEQEQREASSMNTSKIKVAVLMGGDSHEREISLESGRNITYKLSPHKYEVSPIFVTDQMELFTLTQPQLVRNSTFEVTKLLTREQKIGWSALKTNVDFVFIALHGGKGENGSVQGMLEMLEIPYNGSPVLPSALCMDKFRAIQFLRKKGFNVPKSMLVSRNEWQKGRENVSKTIINQFTFPVILKPHDDGCSTFVQKVKNPAELALRVDEFFSHDKSIALLEEFVEGMELTVGVIGNEQPRSLVPSQAISVGDVLSIEEKFLPGAGENQTPAPLLSSVLKFVQKTVENVFQALGCRGYARIDCFYQNKTVSPTGHERVVILEVNTLPGMTPATCIFHQAAELGIRPMELIDKIVSLGFEEHKSKIILKQKPQTAALEQK